MIEIHFHQEDISFSFSKSSHEAWLKKCLSKLKVDTADLTYIFCSDSYLLNVNRESLNHDYYTDIITFDNSLESSDDLFTDMFISIDRVKDNALSYKHSFEDELKRVMIHGVLHLCGFNDKTEVEKAIMRSKENELIKLS